MAFKGDSIYWVEVEKVVPNPFQPRREFDENKLRELADSIRMYGVLQPLTVTRNEVQREDGTFYTEYELIAGERRLRASKLSGVSQVPVIIREGEDSEQEKLELAIIENLQREDLNAVDRALAFRQLAEQFGLSHAQVAQKVGRSREYVSNSIRLLALPEHIIDALRRGEVSEGHARTLLMLSDRPEEQEVVFQELLLKKLSVRELERIVRKIATDRVRKKNPQEFDSELIEMEKQFSETLGTRVQILKTDFGGKVTIDYFSVDDLSVILKRMQKDMQEKSETSAELAKLTSHTPLQIEDSHQEPSVTKPESNSYFGQSFTAHEPAPLTPPVVTPASTESVSAPAPIAPENKPVWPWVKPVVESSQAEHISELAVTTPTEPASSFVPVAKEPETVTPVELIQPNVPATDEAEQKQDHSTDNSSDDSDLYSIRNFTV